MFLFIPGHNSWKSRPHYLNPLSDFPFILQSTTVWFWFLQLQWGCSQDCQVICSPNLIHFNNSSFFEIIQTYLFLLLIKLLFLSCFNSLSSLLVPPTTPPHPASPTHTLYTYISISYSYCPEFHPLTSSLLAVHSDYKPANLLPWWLPSLFLWLQTLS